MNSKASILGPWVAHASLYRRFFIRDVIDRLMVLAMLTCGVSLGLYIGRADTLHVPAQFATIRAAVEAAKPGDTVVIGPGVYKEEVYINKPLKLYGSGAANTVIIPWRTEKLVGGQPGFRGFLVSLAEGKVELKRLAVVGALFAGIDLKLGESASACISEIVASENTAGINFTGFGQLTISKCMLANNNLGISVSGGYAKILNNEVIGAKKGILIDIDTAEIVISGNTIALCDQGLSIQKLCDMNTTDQVFEGTILGEGNQVFAYDATVCPSLSSIWPKAFLVQWFPEVIRSSLDKLELLRSYIYNPSVLTEVAEKTYQDGLTLLQEGKILPVLAAEFSVALGHFRLLRKGAQDAIFLLEQASRVFRERFMLSNIVKVNYLLGHSYLDQNRYNNILLLLREYQDLLPILERCGEPTQVSQMLYDFAAANLALERFGESAGYLLHIYHRYPRYFDCMSRVNWLLGRAFFGLGCYEEALYFFRQVDAQCVTWLLDPSEQLMSNEAAALLLMEVGDTKMALEQCQEAVEDYITARHLLEPISPMGKTHPWAEVAAQLNKRLGLLLLFANEWGCQGFGPPEPEQAAVPALDMFEEASMGFHLALRWNEVAKLNLYRGLAYERMKEYGKAIFQYREARQDFLALNMPKSAALADYYESELYTKLGLYKGSIEVCNRALTIIDNIPPMPGMKYSAPDLRWRLLFKIGENFESLGELETALNHYETAVEVVETLISYYKIEEFKQVWIEKTRNVYERIIDLLYRLGKGTSAFPYTERCRARTFLDILYEGGVKPEQFIGPEEGVVAGGVDPGAIDGAVERSLSLLARDEAVFSYFVTEQGVYLWVITEDGVSEPLFIPYPREKLMQDIHSARVCIEEQENQLMVEEKLAPLYERLVQPGLARLGPGVKTLVIIPSGPLWYLPFAALPITDRPGIPIGLAQRSTYLVEEYILAYLPSLASLAALGERRETAEAPFLGLANPVTEAGGVEAQRFVELERATLAFAKACAGEKGEVYSGEDAKEAVAYHKARGHRVVVYACHGQFNPYVPLQSKLLLAPGDGVEWEEGDLRVPDGDYHAWEALLTDHQGAELVVLAACETLLPAFRHLRSTQAEPAPERLEEITTGDEVVGLVRAFLSSGARAVLATLWQANPEAVKELLVAMAAHRLQGASWAEALALAQRELLATAACAHPWVWAPYQLVGRWR